MVAIETPQCRDHPGTQHLELRCQIDGARPFRWQNLHAEKGNSEERASTAMPSYVILSAGFAESKAEQSETNKRSELNL